jgi:MerR family transcriptional regulator, thiopeptide resistance regulator
MRFEALRVGELARRTGLTIRALHHYDEIGLVRPSRHSEAGYRLYTSGDIARLQQVVSLRQLGFSLEEIRGCLEEPGFSPRELLRQHIDRLKEKITMQRELCERLESIVAHFRAAEDVSAEEFLQTIERMIMIENYYTPEQLNDLKQRRDQIGEDRINQSHTDWAELIAAVRAEKERGTDPGDPKVVALARRWMALVNEFTGGDPGISRSLGRLWNEQGDTIASQHGSEYDPRDLFEYIGKAQEAAKAESTNSG